MKYCLLVLAIDWDVVTAMYNGRVNEDCSRDKPSLTRQFGSLWKVNMPTGNPNIPVPVKRAKHLRYKIQGKSDTVNADEMSKESGEIAGEEEEVTDQPCSMNSPPLNLYQARTNPKHATAVTNLFLPLLSFIFVSGITKSMV